MRNKAHKIYYLLGWIGIAIAFILIIITGFWLTYPYNVISVKQPIEIMNEGRIIDVGEEIITKTTYTKNMPLEATMYPVLLCKSGNLVTFTPVTRNAPVGTATIESAGLILPPKVLPGDQCQLAVTQVYQVNPIRKVSYVFYSDYFTVGKDTIE